MHLTKRVEGGLNYERISVCTLKRLAIAVIRRIVMDKKCKVYKNKKKLEGIYLEDDCVYIFSLP